MALRDKISGIGSESNASLMVNKAESVIKECLAGLANMRIFTDSKDLSYFRIQAQKIAGDIFKSLGFLNQIYYKRSWGHYREQVRDLKVKPEQLDQYLDTIMFSHSPDDILMACEKLTASTIRLISEKRNNLVENRSYKERMKGYYEEERGMMNKLLTACEKGHYETAFFVSAGLQDGLARILYAAEKGRWPGLGDIGDYREYYVRFGYPDLVSLLDPTNFEPLRLAVLQLIVQLEKHLIAEGVALNSFDSVAEFEAFYTNKI